MLRKHTSLLILAVLLTSAVESHAIGRLYGRIPNRTNSPIYNLRIKSFDITVTIQDQLATTHIDEIFANDQSRRLEGIYTLELPEGAVLTDMYLWINGERVRQEIRRREEAVEIFEEIVRRQTDPLLGEEVDENVFRFRLFPIEAHSERRLEITYIHLLPYDSGKMTYRFPLDISDFEQDPVEHGALDVNLRSQLEFTSVATPAYPDPPANTITEISPTEFEIKFGDEGFIPDRDYEVVFSVNRNRLYNVLTFTPPDSAPGDGFYLLWLTPPDSLFSDTTAVKNIVLVADVSSSMEGTRLAVLKEALTHFVQELKPDDRFNVIAFSTGVTRFRQDLVSATPVNIQDAIDYISRLAALGLTNLEAAMSVALEHTFDPAARSLVVLFTDGAPNDGIIDPAVLLSNIRDNNSANASIFPVGIGDSVDEPLLHAIAAENSGLVFLESDEELLERIPQIAQRVASPVLQSVSLSYTPFLTYDSYPLGQGSLAFGSQLVDVGRFIGPPMTLDLELSGNLAGRSISLSEQVDFAEKGSVEDVSRAWAARKIDFLLEQIDLLGEIDELVDAVVNLSIDYSVLSPYTAFLVIEPGEESPITDVDEQQVASVPESFALFQNYPNPFNPETSITYHIARSDECGGPCGVTLRIYNVLGELVRTLVDEAQGPGEYSVMWNGRDELGNAVPSGVYVYRLEVGEFSSSRRMLMLK